MDHASSIFIIIIINVVIVIIKHVPVVNTSGVQHVGGGLGPLI